MSFVAEFNRLPIESLVNRSLGVTGPEVDSMLGRSALSLSDFAMLVSPAAGARLEELSRRSHALTVQRFGKVIRLFAPLYLSNECINNCKYCGFSRDNPILRVTLSQEEVLQEARSLQQNGFRHILLVAGEHPRFVSNNYLAESVRTVQREVSSVSLEVGPMGTSDYTALVAAGAEGLVVYQETYQRRIYADMHTAGPKRDFDERLGTAERAYAAGFRRLGIGALFGLSDWRAEAICLAAHAAHLVRHCWKAQVTVSLPRLRPCAGQFEPLTGLSDRELVQLICAFRLFLPDVGLVLSTREPSRLRDGLIPLGITTMSAGSHTEPGGYTGAGAERVHLTQRGRIVELTGAADEWQGGRRAATGQFDTADDRSPEEVAAVISKLGYEPVWKDWDAALLSA